MTQNTGRGLLGALTPRLDLLVHLRKHARDASCPPSPQSPDTHGLGFETADTWSVCASCLLVGSTLPQKCLASAMPASFSSLEFLILLSNTTNLKECLHL